MLWAFSEAAILLLGSGICAACPNDALEARAVERPDVVEAGGDRKNAMALDQKDELGQLYRGYLVSQT